MTSKTLWQFLLFLSLVPALLAQGTQGTGTTRKTTSTTKKTTTVRRGASTTTAGNSDIQALRDALAAQQAQIQQQQQLLLELKQQLQSRDQATQQSLSQLQQAQSAATTAQEKAAAAETAANEQKDPVTKLQTDVADVKTNMTSTVQTALDEQKKLSGIQDFLSRFRFTGDVRVRGENLVQDYSGCKGCFDRNRARFRARFGVEGQLSEDFVGGLFVASGSNADPTTTNETLTNAFNRKLVGWDRAYIIYNPTAHKWLSLTGGKFAYSWNRTSVTFDPDLNPEGFSQKLSFDLKSPFIKNVTLQGMELFFNEVSKGPDSYAAGGQVSTKLSFMKDRITITPSATLLNWHLPDALLQASAFTVGATTTGSPSTGTPPPVGTPVIGPLPITGPGPGCAGGSGLPSFPPCVFAPNGFTNATVVDAKGVPHFRSRFLYADALLNTQVKTGMERLPLNFLLEYENNLNARHPNNVGVGRQAHAYYGELSLGQTKNKNDLQFGYAFLRQEQDSVLAAFNESDQRAPTNIVQHRAYVQWKVRKNIVAGYTLWVGRTLNSNLQHAALASGIKPGQVEPYLKRMQFDLVYSF
ncbi:MAG TPA: putative porin [Terriglobales bacterium]|nr:putative porin [Terriglobales bacterium]